MRPPTAGAPSSTVTLFGTHFTGVTSVLFNTVPAAIQPGGDDTQVRVTVPFGAPSGPLVISNGAGSATSVASFTVLPFATLTGFSPTSGPLGTTVVLSGDNLTGTTSVSVGGKAAAFKVDSPTQITTAVPGGAITAPITLVGPTGFSSSASSFVVTSPTAPTVTGFSPRSGTAGGFVTLTGSHFTGLTGVTLAGAPLPFVNVQSDTQLSLLLPPGASTGPFVVSSGPLTGSSLTSFVVLPAPALTGFSPASGPQGAAVVLLGTNLGGATSVQFNGAPASFTVNSPSQLTAIVPAASSGPIVVTTPDGQAGTTTGFGVQPSGPPTLSGFTPSAGSSQSTVTLTGTHFRGALDVSLAGRSLEFTVSSDFSLAATLPPGVTSGKLTVTNSQGTATSSGSFTVVAAPTLSGLSPASGAVGSAVTLTGTGLAGASQVLFADAAPASFVVTSPTQLLVKVPAGALTGPVRVLTADDAAVTTQFFTVTSTGAPALTGFSPARGAGFTTVTVTGAGFGGATAVRLGALQAGFNVLSDGLLTFQVPTGATSGPISVTNPLGVSSSTGTFTVVGGPRITSINPFTGPVGASIDVRGTGLAAVTGVGFVNTPATFTSQSDFQLTAIVPSGAVDGPLSVTSPGGTEYSPSAFLVQGSVPTLLGFSPPAGAALSVLVVSGTGFSGTTAVSIAGSSASFAVLDDSTLQLEVPAGIGSGPIFVATRAGTATSAASFTVFAPPLIGSLSPGAGPAGTVISTVKSPYSR